MSVPRQVCHRCRTKWKARRPRRDCPKCGSEVVGPTDPAMGLLPKLLILVVIGGVAAYFTGYLTDDDLDRAKREAQDVQKQAEQESEGVRKEVEKRADDVR